MKTIFNDEHIGNSIESSGKDLLRHSILKFAKFADEASKGLRKTVINYEQRNRASVPFKQGSTKYRIRGER